MDGYSYKNRDKQIFFIYFKSAFDSVSHEGLFNKLQKIVVDNKALNKLGNQNLKVKKSEKEFCKE